MLIHMAPGLNVRLNWRVGRETQARRGGREAQAHCQRARRGAQGEAQARGRETQPHGNCRQTLPLPSDSALALRLSSCLETEHVSTTSQVGAVGVDHLESHQVRVQKATMCVCSSPGKPPGACVAPPHRRRSLAPRACAHQCVRLRLRARPLGCLPPFVRACQCVCACLCVHAWVFGVRVRAWVFGCASARE